MRTIRISDDEYREASAEVINEILHDKDMPTDLIFLESLVAMRVTTKLEHKLFYE